MRYRRNGFTIAAFQQFCQEKGLGRLAELVGKYPEEVEPYLPKIEARLREKGLLSGGAAAGGPLSDREAWLMLADLVPKALGDQPAEVQSALITAFREEASRAA
jgi:hypothetical protein